MTDTVDVHSLSFPSALLVDMADEQFFASFWRRRFLHQPGGAAALLHLMPSIDEVEALIDRPGHLEDDLVSFISFPVEGDRPYRRWGVGATEAVVRDHREAVNLAPADRWFFRLYALKDAMQRSFRAPVSLQLFWGPPGGGLKPHRDMNDSFIIQIVGAKQWRGDDLDDDRPTRSGIGAGELSDAPRTFDLLPGDVLYKPSHAVHTTISSDEPTLSLTCSVATRTAGELALDVLRDRLASDPAWLERLPLTGGDGSDDDAARPRIEAALAGLPGLLPTLADLEAAAER